MTSKTLRDELAMAAMAGGAMLAIECEADPEPFVPCTPEKDETWPQFEARRRPLQKAYAEWHARARARWAYAFADEALAVRDERREPVK